MSEKRPYHHGDLRASLIDAGLEILRKEGLEALTLRRAAREASVSATAPYRHFKDKQSLLAAISEFGFRKLHRMLSASNVTQPGDLNASGQAYLQFAFEEPALYALMFTKNLLCESTEVSELKEAGQSAFGALVATIETGLANGLIKPCDSLELSLSAWALVHGTTMLLLDGVLAQSPFSELTPSQVLDRCQQHFSVGWRALQPS